MTKGETLCVSKSEGGQGLCDRDVWVVRKDVCVTILRRVECESRGVCL